MELTYEELKEVLEMSGMFDGKQAGEIIEAMNQQHYSPSLGDVVAYCRHSGLCAWTKDENAKLIEACSQYTSGKLEK